MSAVNSFANIVKSELIQLDPRAKALQIMAKKDRAVFGIDDDQQFVPLFCLASGTPKLNKMMLFAFHKGCWQSTCHKGTPKMLAQLLHGHLNYLWTLPLSMVGWHPDSPPTKIR